jgi:hypothetical protein
MFCAEPIAFLTKTIFIVKASAILSISPGVLFIFLSKPNASTALTAKL